MSDLNWVKHMLDEDIDSGNILGYVTNTRIDVQLMHYMNDHHKQEATQMIREKYEVVALLKSMWIDEEFRNKGKGTFLLKNFIKNAQKKKAEAIVLIADTGESNEFDLVKWYENHGFEIKYGDRENHPVMIKEIS